MKNIGFPLAAVVLAAGLALAAAPAVADPIVIVHPGVTEASLNGGQVKELFLGNRAQWGGGARVMLCMLGDDAVSRAFLTTYVGKSHKQFTMFWKKAVFSGTGAMPHDFTSEAELVAHVAGTVGAIGYIDAATPHKGVKVLTIN